MREFADWLATTGPSQYIQINNAWAIPLVQSIHILAIGIAIASIFMVDLRVLGLAGQNLTLAQTTRRYAPWMWGAFVVLVLTGVLMIIGEPVRELLSFSFWVKMGMIAVGIFVAAMFQRHLRRNEIAWETTIMARASTKWFAVLVFLLWLLIVVMGRLIAFDVEFWGSLSPNAAARGFA